MFHYQPHPKVAPSCTLKSERAWYAKSRARIVDYAIPRGQNAGRVLGDTPDEGKFQTEGMKLDGGNYRWR